GFAPAPALVPTTPKPVQAADVAAPDEEEAPPAAVGTALSLGRKASKETAVPESSEESVPAPKAKKSLFGRSQAAAPVPETSDEPASPPMTADREAAIRRM